MSIIEQIPNISETARQLLECEPPAWQKVFIENWQDVQEGEEQEPLEDVIRQSIRLRTLVSTWFQNYLETNKVK